MYLTFFIPQNTRAHHCCPAPNAQAVLYRVVKVTTSDFFANVHLFGVSWHCFLSLSRVKKLESAAASGFGNRAF